MAPGTHRLRAIAAALVTALLLVLSGREPLSAQAGSAQAGSPVYWVCLALLLATVALAARIASLW